MTTNSPTEQPRECNCIDCRVGRDLGLKPNYPTDPTVDSIGEFIRDVTQVIPRPKSEVRRRLNAILSHSVQEAKAEERERIIKELSKIITPEGFENPDKYGGQG